MRIGLTRLTKNGGPLHGAVTAVALDTGAVPQSVRSRQGSPTRRSGIDRTHAGAGGAAADCVGHDRGGG